MLEPVSTTVQPFMDCWVHFTNPVLRTCRCGCAANRRARLLPATRPYVRTVSPHHTRFSPVPYLLLLDFTILLFSYCDSLWDVNCLLLQAGAGADSGLWCRHRVCTRGKTLPPLSFSQALSDNFYRVRTRCCCWRISRRLDPPSLRGTQPDVHVRIIISLPFCE